MLQRAASNAYTWWWASHIRTKQSKWLDMNLQDMEVRIRSMLNLIEEDADTFAKKAEMYYKRRPELVTFVQDVYKSYRALAERYDHLSGELHKANNTIATVFPDQVHYGIDDEDDEMPSRPPPPVQAGKIHKLTHSFDESALAATKSLKLPPTRQKPAEHKRAMSMVVSKETTDHHQLHLPPPPGRDKARDEIDLLQKGILSLQTEKEFVKSSYESGLTRYWDIEKQITDMQERVCRLQDEFSAEMVIEDDEARAVMAVTALKSCEDTLVELRERQARSSEEARTETRRIRNARRKLRALKCQYGYLEADGLDSADMTGESSADEIGSDTAPLLKHERLELQSVCERVRQHFQMNSEVSGMELAEKIDGLVNQVITLESTVSSQTAQIERLRMEMDEMQRQLQALEEEKASLIEGSNDLSDRLRRAEEQLRLLQSLNQSVSDEGGKLDLHLTEACQTFSDLSDRLQSPEEKEGGNSNSAQSEGAVTLAPEKLAGNSEQLKFEKTVEPVGENGQQPTDPHLDSNEKGREENEKVKRVVSLNDDRGVEIGDSALSNWQKLFLVDELEDREKILLGEYMSILHNYKEVKRKLMESENKNQHQLFETMAQIRDLKSIVVMKDEEIQSLRQKLSFVEPGWNRSSTMPSVRAVSGDRTLGSLFANDGASDQGSKSFWVEEQQSSSSTTTTEERFRKELDELLSEHLEFWLRFSSSVQRIQTYQAAVGDLQTKMMKLKDRKKQESSSGSTKHHPTAKDEASSIYKQLKELQSDLAVWTEQNAILKEELQSRFSSLCAIRDELVRVADREEGEFTTYQAAKFHGEVINMQQENNRVSNELQMGLDHVREIQKELERVLAKLPESFDLSSASKGLHQYNFRNFSMRSRIPLRSFLFGVKPKKPSIFSCMNPALQKQHSDLRVARLPHR